MVDLSKIECHTPSYEDKSRGLSHRLHESIFFRQQKDFTSSATLRSFNSTKKNELPMLKTLRRFGLVDFVLKFGNKDMKDETRHDSKNAENHTEGCCTIKVIKGH